MNSVQIDHQRVYEDVVRRLYEKYQAHFIRVAQAAQEIGLSVKTIYNQVSEARFPIKTFKRGKLLLVSIYELARFIVDYPDTGRMAAMAKMRADGADKASQETAQKQAMAAPVKRGRGRPRNSELRDPGVVSVQIGRGGV